MSYRRTKRDRVLVVDDDASLAEINPLYHCVNLIRDAVFGWQPVEDLISVAVLCVFAAIMAFLAVRSLRGKLID